MEKRKVCLDNLKLVELLESIAVAVESEKKLKKNIYPIEKAINDFIKSSNLDKQQLVSKWVQVVGSKMYEQLLVKTTSKYYEKLALVLQSGAIYLNKTFDPLYLVAGLTVLTDCFLYGKINLQDS